ncbi:retroviral-like aspartic protease family protein [Leptolyngbya sp. PCC 6406]|uniref:retroviral-like aspartic protease family protein n=1 Tax=Leptolyngbya sp. PCC 6406 TaxID=1173264 RepID=UPI0002AC30DA|nr:retroviral-like aspartic protease family protein [Leptolyngbya sp. PCC 6406]
MVSDTMGITYAEIELIRGDDLALERAGYLSADQVSRITVLALVDSGASMLTIPKSLSQRLNLSKLDQVQAELADGSIMEAEVVGPLEVRFQNRKALVEAIVVNADTDVLLGAIPMQRMDVLVDPKREQLIVNPSNPDTARMLLK